MGSGLLHGRCQVGLTLEFPQSWVRATKAQRRHDQVVGLLQTLPDGGQTWEPPVMFLCPQSC